MQVPVRTLTSEAVAAKKPAEVSKVLAQEPWVEMSLASGKHTKNYGKSPFLMGKLTISMAIFNSFLYVYQRVYPPTTNS